MSLNTFKFLFHESCEEVEVEVEAPQSLHLIFEKFLSPLLNIIVGLRSNYLGIGVVIAVMVSNLFQYQSLEFSFRICK